MQLLLRTALAGVFFYSLSFKAINFGRVRAMVSQMRLHVLPPTLGAVLIVAAEGSAALVLILVRSPEYASALSATLGAAMILVGLAAIRSGETILCACFSAAGATALGTRQLVAGGVIVGASVVMWRTPPLLLDWSTKANLVSAVALTAVGVHCVLARNVVAQLVGLRRAAAFAYPA